MSREEEKAYKDSMQDLCSLLKKASREKLDGKNKKRDDGSALLDDNGNGSGGDNIVPVGRVERRALSRTPIDEEGPGLSRAVSRTSVYSDIDLD